MIKEELENPFAKQFSNDDRNEKDIKLDISDIHIIKKQPISWKQLYPQKANLLDKLEQLRINEFESKIVSKYDFLVHDDEAEFDEGDYWDSVASLKSTIFEDTNKFVVDYLTDPIMNKRYNMGNPKIKKFYELINKYNILDKYGNIDTSTELGKKMAKQRDEIINFKFSRENELSKLKKDINREYTYFYVEGANKHNIDKFLNQQGVKYKYEIIYAKEYTHDDENFMKVVIARDETFSGSESDAWDDYWRNA